MSLSGNKGEWSEIYTLFKLLGEGLVHAGDEHLSKIEAIFYPIVYILREERETQIKYRRIEQEVSIETVQGERLLTMQASQLLAFAEQLLLDIKANHGSFNLPHIEEFMHSIHCHSLKANSNEKADIKLVLHDPRTKINSLIGFSIKSQLGNPSTLLNASQATNFIFRIQNGSLSENEIQAINQINSRRKIIDRIREIKSKQQKLVFHSIQSSTFAHNIRMIDGDLPFILAELLKAQAETETNDLLSLVKTISKNNPLECDEQYADTFYTYKIKHFLITIALGLMPASPWSGRFDANGGYLVVKNDGDILCYHFYDRNRVEDYLLTNAFLDRPSTSRHQYGQLYKDEEGNLYIKLNMQIRLR